MAAASCRTSLALAALALSFPLLGCPAGEAPPTASASGPAQTEPADAGTTRGYSEERTACTEFDPQRSVYWGELHVHSRDSMDAYMWDTRGTPDDVYRFARGEAIGIPPLDRNGRPLRRAQLERPLDFAALTDHASYLGEVSLCTRPDSALYDSPSCRIYRGELDAPASTLGELGARMSAIALPLELDREIPGRSAALCGADFAPCIAETRSVWAEQQAAAERHYDRSAECSFTTFHGYEYSATPAMSKVHHNVIFRNAKVPASPVAWVDEPDVYGLWERLRAECTGADTGCDVLTIPHNSNLSSGRMFVVTGRELPIPLQQARARLRADMEPLVEVSQIKGDSECRNGMYDVVGAPDEFCNSVEWGPPVAADCKEASSSGALMGLGCVSRTDFVRYTLIEGLRERRRIGVNPYKLAAIAATDTHNATPGDTEEFSYDGWSGSVDDTPAKRLASPASGDPMRGALADRPGGLAGVWAEENSRDSIFDAMQRRETFGTSGTRLSARFFGGWDLPDDLCDDPDFVAKGYALGVPMGADLPPRPSQGGVPSFAISALADPGAPGRSGGLLQRAQVIKGWVDAAGRFRQEIYAAAGGANAAAVDLATCEPRGPGAPTLCSVWRDPDFDPTLDAVYYLRVLENPSCRWNQFQCLELPVQERPASCSDPAVVRTIQERLWSAPIWYETS